MIPGGDSTQLRSPGSQQQMFQSSQKAAIKSLPFGLRANKGHSRGAFKQKFVLYQSWQLEL